MPKCATAARRSCSRSDRWSSTATICQCMSTCCCRSSSRAGSPTAIGALVAPPFTYGYKSHQKSGGGNHLPGHDQPRRRDARRRAARRHQGVRAPRRAAVVPRQRPFRELLVHRRGDRPRAPRTALGRHRRHEDRRALLLGLRRQGDDRAALPGRLYRLGGRARRRARDLADAGALSGPRASRPRGRPSAGGASRPTTSIRSSPEWTPPSGTLSSPKKSSAREGRDPARRLPSGIVSALRAEFA